MVTTIRNQSSALARLFEGIRHLPDRLLYSRRRVEAGRRLREIGRIDRILVVCSGNICRSPYLAAVLTRALPSTRIASAGFVGFDRPVPDHSLAIAATRGIDLSSFRSRSVEAHRARTADLVVVMEPWQARCLSSYFGVSPRRIVVVGDLDPIAAPTRSILDPYQQPLQAFEAAFARLDRCAAKLVRIVQPTAALSPSVKPVPRSSERGSATRERLPQPVL